jgi:hypothetical protein
MKRPRPLRAAQAGLCSLTPWKELQTAEAAAGQPDASPSDFLRAAQDASLLLTAGATARAGRATKGLDDRYRPVLLQWGYQRERARDCRVVEALGDAELFGSGSIWRFGMRCWPAEAAAAYQHAADLGSDAADQEVTALHGGGDYGAAEGVDAATSKPLCGDQGHATVQMHETWSAEIFSPLAGWALTGVSQSLPRCGGQSSGVVARVEEMLFP